MICGPIHPSLKWECAMAALRRLAGEQPISRPASRFMAPPLYAGGFRAAGPGLDATGVVGGFLPPRSLRTDGGGPATPVALLSGR
jgi:hypothetical protein